MVVRAKDGFWFQITNLHGIPMFQTVNLSLHGSIIYLIHNDIEETPIFFMGEIDECLFCKVSHMWLASK
jgi:hypothetical protein